MNINFSSICEISNDEEKALSFATELSLIPLVPPFCYQCNQFMRLTWEYDRGKKRFRNCRKRESVYKNTIFYKSHLSVSQFLKIMYCHCLGLKVDDGCVECDVNKKTYCRITKILRSFCVNAILQQEIKLIGGPGMTVEIDETHLYKRKYNRGRVLASEAVWLVGGICRETGDVFLHLTTRRDSSTLHKIISSHVSSESTIITDCWAG